MPIRPAFTSRTLVRCIMSIALLALPAVAATARAQGKGPEDMRTLANYRLTMPTLRKVLGAIREMKADAESKKLEAAGEEGFNKDIASMSLAEIAAEYDRLPPAKRAIARSGLSTREWVTAFASFIWATRVIGEQELAKMSGKAPITPGHVPQENVDLVRQNEAEIERLRGDS